ncbi:MAG: hypothetical protein C4538_03670 [Nitrospiraceae bacterium]|nr:MAG: hypothetical protein C4538_03670 [Nitrospiraceae bacterium]
MALKDIIGQERAVNILQGCIAKERIPHALLFAGDEGIGKKLTAVNFVKALNCNKTVKKPGSEEVMELLPLTSSLPDSITPSLPDSCDACSSCTKTEKRNHPDVFFIEPEGDGEQITVAAIRELEEALRYKPFEGNYKAAVIDQADRMNAAAANAFLDTLEAPPPQSILILISARPEMLLPTIRSRCQRINFNPLPLHVMCALIQERSHKVSREHAMLLGELSGGRLGYAMQEDLIEQRDHAFTTLKDMINRTDEEEGGDMKELLDSLQVWLRDMAVFKATGRSDLLINRDREDEMTALLRGAALEGILKLARELYNIRKNMYFSLNEKLTRNYINLLIRKRLGRIHAGKQ